MTLRLTIRSEGQVTQADTAGPGDGVLVGLALLVSALLLIACAAPVVMAAPTTPLPAAIPTLPFPDNPDPTLCGIPQPDGRRGIVTGQHEGEVVGDIIYLYDGHARQAITGQVFPGAQVEIVLRQSNPTLDYYFVKTTNVEPAQKGWVPAPFVEVE
jgi:hypothetical protein